MALEDYIQPVVTVAAFDPMRDSIFVIAGEQEVSYLPHITLQSWEGLVDAAILNEVNKRYGTNGLVLNSFDSFIDSTQRPARLYDYRVMACCNTPSGEEVNSKNFDHRRYSMVERKLIARLFAEHSRTGTLLSTLKQPVYVRPTFIDHEGDQVLIPLENHRGGRPRTFLREDHKHIHDVLGDVAHEYIGKRHRQATVTRMQVAAKRLVWRNTEIPAWVMDYGIEVNAEHLRALREKAKVVAISAGSNNQFTLDLPRSYSAEARAALTDMRTIIAHVMTSGETDFHQIHFGEDRKTGPIFR